MKTFFLSLILFCFLFFSCSKPKEKITPTANNNTSVEITDTVVVKSVLQYNHKISLWTLNDLPYSGYAVTYYPDQIIKEKFGILNGKKQNKAIQWYRDGHFKNVANYDKGKLHGEKKIWIKDSTYMLISHLNYYKGKLNGEQKKWYPTGELFKKLNLKNGKEEGIQQAFRKNGDLYANYEAKAGRIFGLKKAALCYSLKDEKTASKKVSLLLK